MNESTYHANERGWAPALRDSARSRSLSLSRLRSSCSPAAGCRAEQSREDAATTRLVEITTAACVTIVDPTFREQILSRPAAVTKKASGCFYELSPWSDRSRMFGGAAAGPSDLQRTETRSQVRKVGRTQFMSAENLHAQRWDI